MALNFVSFQIIGLKKLFYFFDFSHKHSNTHTHTHWLSIVFHSMLFGNQHAQVRWSLLMYTKRNCVECEFDLHTSWRKEKWRVSNVFLLFFPWWNKSMKFDLPHFITGVERWIEIIPIILRLIVNKIVSWEIYFASFEWKLKVICFF